MMTQPIWSSVTGITGIGFDDAQRLSASQIPGIRDAWKDQKTRLKDTSQLFEFNEKLSREWAIETGVIENLYEIERGVTATLIEHGFQAELLGHGSTNKPREYVLAMLRDQKAVLDGVFDFVGRKRALSVSYIKELHAALLRSQTTTEGVDTTGRSVEIPLIKGAWKVQANSPVRDGVTYAYCPPEQVASEMDRLVEFHAEHVAKAVPSEVCAAWLHHRFTQIHPFQDGNGRVARALTSLVLIKDDLFPFVVTRDDRKVYIDALEKADGGDLKPLIDLVVKLQIAQFRKATAISEAVLVQGNVRAILDGIRKKADKIASDRLGSVRHLAEEIQRDLVAYLEPIGIALAQALHSIHNEGNAFVSQSEGDTDYYFRYQIIENARSNLHYFADTTEYRSWVALNMNWSRRARLVFAIHGIGRPFNGSLICAPFLEFRDTDEEKQIRSDLVPVSEEGLVFFYNEETDRLLARFQPWRDKVVQVALEEIYRGF